MKKIITYETYKYEYFCDKCKRQVFYSGDLQEINGQDVCSKCIKFEDFLEAVECTISIEV